MTTEKPKARIIRSGRLIFVEPLPPGLKRNLTFTRTPTVAQYRPRVDLHTCTITEEMFAPDPDNPDRYLVPAGFTFRVSSLLQRLGYEIEYEDRRQLNLEEPNFDKLPPLHEWEREGFSRILSSAGGIISVGPAAGKTFLIEHLCSVLPNTTFVITSHKTVALVSLYRRLRARHGEEVTGLNAIAKHRQSSRITLCHIRSLLSAPIDRCQILCYDEVHGAAAPERSSHLSKVSFANMYGFSATAEGRLDRAEPIIEALFGPVIYEMTHSALVEEGLVSPIDVHIYDLDGPIVEADTYMLRQLIGIIRNSYRNRAIAEVARQYQDNSIIIVAQDNLEHVFRLHRELPEFTPVYASRSMTASRRYQLQRMGLIPEGYRSLYPGEEHALADKFRKGTLKKAICTSVWDEALDIPTLEVVIRADGRPGSIQAMQIPGRVARKKEEPGILVDFVDNFGSYFVRRSRQRLSHYRKLGFRIKPMVCGRKATAATTEPGREGEA